MFALWYIANYTTTPFLGTYQNKELGFDMTFISLLTILYSIVRIACSFFWGSFADKRSFKSMLQICIGVAGIGFLLNFFTVPANGKILFTLFRIFNAVSMAGINSALINLIYDYVTPDRRSDAIAVTQIVSGVVGFMTTLVVGYLVTHIQQSGNTLFGVPVYAQQVNSLMSTIMCIIVILYLHFCIQDRKVDSKTQS